MAGPRFDIGERVWHPADKDNGHGSGFGTVITRQAKASHTAHAEGFTYRLRCDEDHTALNTVWDENSLKKAEDAEKEIQEEAVRRQAEQKKQEAEKKKLQSTAGEKDAVVITTDAAGNPPANPNLSGGPISTTGTVQQTVVKKDLPPGTPGVPIPAVVPPKPEPVANAKPDENKQPASPPSGVPSGLPPLK